MNYGDFRLVWIFDVRFDLNARAAFLGRAQFGYFLQSAASH
jgi:hypothetical protein